MSFLGDFNPLNIVNAVTRPVTRLLGPEIATVLFPAIAASQLAGQAINVVGRSISRVSTPSTAVSPGVQQIHENGGPTPSYNVSYQAPYYGGGGSYDAYNFQPAYNPYTQGETWGSSIQSPQYSIPQYQTYSAPTQDRTWEDLALQALPFFL
jgi:Ni/Co efflux regulator RcnB